MLCYPSNSMYLSTGNINRIKRLDYLVMCAYWRYQRRLNRCVLCYQHRLDDCNREFAGHKRRFCPALIKQPQKDIERTHY